MSATSQLPGLSKPDFQAAPAWSIPCDSSRFIFVGGAPRSGTSLVQKMLGFHSEVYAGPEFDHLPAIMRLYRQMIGGEAWRQRVYYNHETLRASIAAFVASLLLPCAERNGLRLISEKTPHNVEVFAELADAFPEAKFVFVVRDPRALVYSLQQVGARAHAQGSARPAGDYILADLRRIEHCVRAGDRFAAANPDRCTVVHYEKLVAQPAATASELCSFLGIAFEPQMLHTDRPNEDVQAVIDKSGYVWYTPQMYNSPIDPARRDTWKSGLSPTLALLVADFFARQGYACHAPYSLRPASGRRRLRCLAALVCNRLYSRLRAQSWHGHGAFMARMRSFLSVSHDCGNRITEHAPRPTDH